MGERERKNGEEGGERNLYKSVLNFIAFEAVLQLALWLWEKVTDWGTFGVSAATAASSAGVSAAVLTVLGSKCSKKAKANCILAMLLFLLLVVVVVVVVALLIMQARSSQAEPREWFLPRQQFHLPRLPHWLPIVGTFACRRVVSSSVSGSGR